MSSRSREEHIAWCKEQALEYLDRGDTTNAVASMMSDLGKHPETVDDGMMFAFAVGLHTAMSHDPDECRRFIEGFR